MPPPPTPIQAAPARANNEPKIQDGLKPKLLTKDNNPVEVRNWIKQYKLYYRRSAMERAPVEDQRGLLENCLDEDIQRHLHTKCEDDTPIFVNANFPTNCIKEIEYFFMIRYPLLSRRFEILKDKHVRGTSYTKFLMTFMNKCDEADVESITGKEIQALLAILACNNDELRKELMKLIDPSINQIIQKAAEFEQIENNLKQTMDTARGFEVKSDSKKKPKSNNNQGDIRCYRCHKTTHTSNECTLSRSIVCDGCGKKGHLKAACRSGGNSNNNSSSGKKQKAKQVKEDDENSSDEEEVATAKTVRAGAATPTFLL